MATYRGREAAAKAVEESKKRRREGGHFLNLSDGDKVVVAFLGDPLVRERIWKNGRSVDFTEEDEKNGEAPTMKFAFNVYNKEAGKVQIFEQGVTWYEQVMACENKYGLNVWYEMSRTGSKRDDTKYKVLFEKEMTDQEIKDLQTLADKDGLFDLEAKLKDKADDEEESDSDKTNGAKISDEAREQIKKYLSDVPRTAIGKFLRKFEVAKISEVKASEEEEAVLYAQALGAEARGEEVDPFS